MKKAFYFVLGFVAILTLAVSCDASAADPDEVFANVCADCHEASDFSGEPVKEIEASLTAIVKGTVKHKQKLPLTPAEITEMAEFLSK